MTAYFSEILYQGPGSGDFIEIAVPEGTDVSGYSVELFRTNGSLHSTISLGTIQSTANGEDIYLIDSSSLPAQGLASNQGLALIDDGGNVLQFVSFEANNITASQGNAAGETSVSIGGTSNDKSLESNDGGDSYYENDSPDPGTGSPPVCYSAGTFIKTPDGARRVETLAPGDLVITADSGAQEILWISQNHKSLDGTTRNEKPVLISAGALGPDKPETDLVVSPQHRILVGANGQLQNYFPSAQFAPAKSLTCLPGIRHMNGKKKITWVHFACARHEIVLANGCHTESLLLGKMVINGLSHAERRSLSGIFGLSDAAGEALNGAAARPCLRVGEVRRRLTKAKGQTDGPGSEPAKWDRDPDPENTFPADNSRGNRVA